MTPRTQFVETEALLIALEDGESERLVEYLAANFLPSELTALNRACRALSWAARDVETARRSGRREMSVPQ